MISSRTPVFPVKGNTVHPALATLIVFAIISLTLAALPGTVLADQLVINGSFTSGFKAWTIRSGPGAIKVEQDKAGRADKASLLCSSSGAGSKADARISQRITYRLKAGSSATVAFAWKKNWSKLMPRAQRLYLDIIKPDGSRVNVWADKATQNNNEWKDQSVDISPALDQDGSYIVSFSISFENGNNDGAVTYAWLDDVRLDVTSKIDSGPKTSILNPIGARKLTGTTYAVNGIALDDLAVVKTEVGIIQVKDGAWWNGTSWEIKEFWNPAKIVSGKNEDSVAWSYTWSLPTSDGDAYTILARSTDVTGNLEALPAQNTVLVDTIGPTGSITIEDGARKTNKQDIHVDIDILGAAMMRFATGNGGSWSDWEPVAPTKMLKLPSTDGTKVVSAQFMDDSGNIYRVSDNIVLDTTPPVTRTLFPQSNATKVSPESSVGIIFYEDMDTASFRNDGTEPGSSIYIKQGSRWIAADASYDATSKSAKLVPKEKLDSGTTYTIYLTTGIKDLAGNPLAANFSWSFTTSGQRKSSLQARIGKAGGKLEDTGQLISLEIPPDALAADTTITVEDVRDEKNPAIDSITRYSAIYKMAPDNMMLGKPAIVKIRYRPDDVQNPTDLRLVYFNTAAQKWETVGNSRIDLVNNQIIAPMSFLSAITITAQSNPIPPTTSILAPTGATMLSGKASTIYGLANDDAGISNVEIAITRLSDGANWDGNLWRDTEEWLKANIVSGRKQRQAAWMYIWRLPNDNAGDYQIKARATDTNGNMEPVSNIVLVKLSGK